MVKKVSTKVTESQTNQVRESSDTYSSVEALLKETRQLNNALDEILSMLTRITDEVQETYVADSVPLVIQSTLNERLEHGVNEVKSALLKANAINTTIYWSILGTRGSSEDK